MSHPRGWTAADQARATSLSFQHPESGEWAHSRLFDLFEESWRSYLEPAWPSLWEQSLAWPQDRPLRITEIGFGRGFNLAVAMRMWQHSRSKASVQQERMLQASAFEVDASALEPWPPCPEEWQDWMPWWGQSWPDSGSSWQWPHLGELNLRLGTAESQPWPEPKQDLLVLDLFSPTAHPESWSDELMACLASHSRPGTLLTTYSCARLVREKLRAHGFQTQRIRRRGWRDTLLAIFLGPGAAG
jgi:tRNA U34 5-methylaminomethyl-2-thiouridine-forming methyltransferase MnmC